jgi:hypothetical protein
MGSLLENQLWLFIEIENYSWQHMYLFDFLLYGQNIEKDQQKPRDDNLK